MPPGGRFVGLGIERNYENMRWIGERDVIMPSLGGAGSSLVGNLLLELGLDYIDLGREVLLPDGSSVAPTDSVSRRLRPPAEAVLRRRADPHAARFMKTHLPAEEFASYRFRGVWVLVRDPRDALYSWYRYHRDFGEAEWERVEGSFENFLRAPFFTGSPPADGWASFYEGWLQRAGRCSHMKLLRFEDLKRDPLTTISRALTGLDLNFDPEALRRAIERSSYDSMRAREDVVAGDDAKRPRARILRSGTVEEWRTWMTPRLAEYFSGVALSAVAQRLGYDLSGQET